MGRRLDAIPILILAMSFAVSNSLNREDSYESKADRANFPSNMQSLHQVGTNGVYEAVIDGKTNYLLRVDSTNTPETGLVERTEAELK